MGRLVAALLLMTTAQERAELPREIDSWYLVLHEKKAVGYVHELLKHAPRPSGREYLLESEINLPGRSEDLTFTAVLDETLMPTECSGDVHADGFYSGFVMTTRDERRMEAHRFVGDPVLWTQSGKEDVHLLPSLTLYALRQNGTFDKPGRTTVRAVDPRGVEKGGVEVVIEVGEPERRTYLGKERPVLRISFLKPFPAPSRETELTLAYVDRFGRIVEASMSGGAKLVLAENQVEALAAVGSVLRRGRGEPFDKARAMRAAARERERARRGEPAVQLPTVTADSLMSDFEAARRMIDEIREHKSKGDLEEARKTYLQMLLHLQVIRGVATRKQPELLPQISEVRDLAEQAWPGAANLVNEARLEFVKVKGQMENLDVEAMEATRRRLHGFRERIEVEGRPERETILLWAADAGTLVIRCRTRRDLAQARLDVTGITLGEIETKELLEVPVRQEVLFVRPFAEAEINGRVYRHGDTIQGTKIRVDKITRHSVQVSLRDEVREVPLR